MIEKLKCRHCQTVLVHTFVDLGLSPLSNAYVPIGAGVEKFFPLHAYVCHACFLVQLPVHETPEGIFEEYTYFSSYSSSWLNHAKQYATMIAGKRGLSGESLVVEIACNDGYLLQYFAEMGINVLGIEPAKNVAKAAKSKGIPTISEFFGTELAESLREQGTKADLVVANNVLAHVPDINGFVRGIAMLLKDNGIATLEFPSLLNLIRFNQFDTIYHEHFSYLSLCTVKRIFDYCGLGIFDVEELPTHGGSLRVYACAADVDVSPNVGYLLADEEKFGLCDLAVYSKFAGNVKSLKREILRTLIALKDGGKTMIGYGAAAKGNTLLNYCGIRDDFLDYVADISPYKQGKCLPGTRIRIESTDAIRNSKPDYIFILPWNIKDEIMNQLDYAREWGCKFIVPIPKLEVIT